MRRAWPLLVLAASAVGAWLLPEYVHYPWGPPGGYTPLRWEPGPGGERPPTHVVKDDGPVLRLDAAGPWRLALRQGSVLSGFYVIQLSHDGRLSVYRTRPYRRDGEPHWEVAYEATTGRLPPDEVAGVVAAATAEGLHDLDRSYCDAHVLCGGGWDLEVQQGRLRRVVSCVNHYPAALVRFVTRLDEIIAGSIGPGLVWRPVSFEEYRERVAAVGR
jgi:hypothetical protein